MKSSTRLFAILTTAFALGACGSDDDGSADGGTDGGTAASADDDVGSESSEGGSDGGGTEPTLPSVDGVVFVDAIDNPYLPFPVGARWVTEAQTDEGLEHTEIEVTADTRDIQGVTATVVRDTVMLDGEVIEDTYDWYAQDEDGNVWYLGEDTCEFEGGMCVAMVGAWEWGVDGALPGIVMPADPRVDGQPYYQEYFVGEAQDVGEVVEVGVSVTVPAGTFDDCIVTRETTPLEPDVEEFKSYCPGVGNVLVEEDDVEEQLIEYEI